MWKFLLYRIVLGILVFLTVVVLISVIIYSAPVDPTDLTFGQMVDEESILNKRKLLGLDQSVFHRVINYINDLSPIGYESNIGLEFKKPSLGYSYQSGENVSKLLFNAIPLTFALAFCSFMIAMLFGLVLGIVASLNNHSVLDDLILAITTLGVSVPSYVSAIVFALVFGFLLHSYTGLNIQGSIYMLDDLGNYRLELKNLILPSIALGIRPLSIITQLTRSSMLDELSKDYIRTAQAKGLGGKSLVLQHALQNALNPVITSLTGWFASLLAGAFFVERVFSFKGVGDLTVSALLSYDIPVLLACILFISLVFIVLNNMSDVLNHLLSPQSKL